MSTEDTIKKIKATPSQENAEKIAWDACKWHTNSATDRVTDDGYGPMKIYEMPDGGLITFDGRGWLARK